MTNLFRYLNKIYASILGYFWLPCPICGKMFGGHEASPTVLMQSKTSGMCVCKKCKHKADKMNYENFGLYERRKPNYLIRHFDKSGEIRRISNYD